MLSDPESLPTALPWNPLCPPLTLAQALGTLAAPPAVIVLGTPPEAPLLCSRGLTLPPLAEPQSAFPHMCVSSSIPAV